MKEAFLLDCKFYLLEKAAHILNCSVDDLIQAGADSKLHINVLLGALHVWYLERKGGVPTMDEWRLSCVNHTVHRLHYRCLFEYFSGNQSAVAVLEPKYLKKGRITADYAKSYDEYDSKEFIFQLRRKEYLYPLTSELRDFIRHGIDPSGMIPEPVKLSECKMVVLHDDIERFKQSIASDDSSNIKQTKAIDTTQDKPWLNKQHENDNGSERLGRRQRQIEEICNIAKHIGYDLLDIPDGGKAKIKSECLMRSDLFTESSFGHSWGDASEAGISSLKNKEKYTKNR